VSDGDWWAKSPSRALQAGKSRFRVPLILPFGVLFQVSFRPAAAVQKQGTFVRGIGRPILRPRSELFYCSVNGLSDGLRTSVVSKWCLQLIQPQSLAHPQRHLTRSQVSQSNMFADPAVLSQSFICHGGGYSYSPHSKGARQKQA